MKFFKTEQVLRQKHFLQFKIIIALEGIFGVKVRDLFVDFLPERPILLVIQR
jgi:hypothetical protein